MSTLTAVQRFQSEGSVSEGVRIIDSSLNNVGIINKMLEVWRSFMYIIEKMMEAIPAAISSINTTIVPFLFATNSLSLIGRVKQWFCRDEEGNHVWEGNSKFSIALSITSAIGATVHHIIYFLNNFKPLWNVVVATPLNYIGRGFLALSSVADLVSDINKVNNPAPVPVGFFEVTAEMMNKIENDEWLKANTTFAKAWLEGMHKQLENDIYIASHMGPDIEREIIRLKSQNQDGSKDLEISNLENKKPDLRLKYYNLSSLQYEQRKLTELKDKYDETNADHRKLLQDHMKIKFNQFNAHQYNLRMQSLRPWIGIAMNIAKIVLTILGLVLPFFATANILIGLLIVGLAASVLDLAHSFTKHIMKDKMVEINMLHLTQK